MSDFKIQIPPLRGGDGTWAKLPHEKAELLAATFSGKWCLPRPESNAYSDIPVYVNGHSMSGMLVLRWRNARQCLKALKVNSGTGPDLLPARILQTCATELALPVAKLARLIVRTGAWPRFWCTHWICPLYKSKAASDAKNYRGIQLTAQLSKAMERYIGRLFVPFLETTIAFGENQFAYTSGRGARDALLLMVLSWLEAMVLDMKVGLYCSDVSGAFDRVSSQRVVLKLEALGVHASLVDIIRSWLGARQAHVVVGGLQSSPVEMSDMVYQGTVWGPPLWNTFFADSSTSVHSCGFTEVKFADDLNTYKRFHRSCSDRCINEELRRCQRELHKWGHGNQVVFDPAKESFHIIGKRGNTCGNFKILGINFDTKLGMQDCVHDLVCACGWKLRTLLRTRRYHTDRELVVLFKAHLLSYIEYRTPAIAHASCSVLAPVDRVLDQFLRGICVSSIEALSSFRLAPLKCRRDIAILGFLHRLRLRSAPPQFYRFFSSRSLHHFWGTPADPSDELLVPLSGVPLQAFAQRSAFGMTRVYNLLPQSIKETNSVKSFQSKLQKMLLERARNGCDDWIDTFSCRVSFAQHPLMR